MKKFLLLAGMLVVLAVPATAVAVDLNPDHVGTTCEFGGIFHFVAIGGGPGNLTATFSGGGSVINLPSVKYNNGTTHWTIEAFGTLESASSSVGTKLNLSDFTCFAKKS